MASKMDQETLKILNRQIILNLVRQHREISRVDLTNLTGLSPTTVSTIISELAAKKLVTELRIGESSGGRKPLMIGINPDARYAGIVMISQKGVRFSVVNMNYESVYQEYVERRISGGDQVMLALSAGIERLLKACEKIKCDICGFGISVPGVVDHENGKVLYSSKLQLNELNIGELLEKEHGVKSFVFKDTDALILGEFREGIGCNSKNFIYINVEDGVGMSCVHSGKLLQHGYGGGLELGHITIDSNGQLCRCGNRGCLGAVLSESPAVEKFRSLVDKGCETGYSGSMEQITLEELVSLSNKGDKAARYVLEEQARLLGTAAANVINLFSPQLIAIGGPLSKCTWGFLDILKDTVRDRALGIFSRNVEIKYARLGEESALIGMANEVFEREVFRGSYPEVVKG